VFSGSAINGKKVLEIGPGQTKPLYYALGSKNEYTAIDLEIPPENLTVSELIRIYRENGGLRALKSLGRHLLGIDTALAKALCTQFGGSPSGTFVQGDASSTDFPNDCFDYVMSVSVFEHLPNPATVMDEITRILKPGGTVLTVTHLYTSITGAHDPRLFSDIEALPPWAHLNPQEDHKVQSNSYLNKLRIADYVTLFETHWPGSENNIPEGQYGPKCSLLEKLPSQVRKKFTEQELLADVIVTLWKKPNSAQCLSSTPSGQI
jgi:SAM-dependent methyltransferase